VDEKSNEITAIAELLESLALENTLVSLVVLKARHGHAYAAVQKHFQQHCFGEAPRLNPFSMPSMRVMADGCAGAYLPALKPLYWRRGGLASVAYCAGR
jgi:hypothetical protein